MKRTYVEECQEFSDTIHEMGRIIVEKTPPLRWLKMMLERFAKWLEERN